MRRQAADWEKIFAEGAFDKGLLSKIYREFLKFNNKKYLIKNGPAWLGGSFGRNIIHTPKVVGGL